MGGMGEKTESKEVKEENSPPPVFMSVKGEGLLTIFIVATSAGFPSSPQSRECGPAVWEAIWVDYLVSSLDNTNGLS